MLPSIAPPALPEMRRWAAFRITTTRMTPGVAALSHDEGDRRRDEENVDERTRKLPQHDGRERPLFPLPGARSGRRPQGGLWPPSPRGRSLQSRDVPALPRQTGRARLCRQIVRRWWVLRSCGASCPGEKRPNRKRVQKPAHHPAAVSFMISLSGRITLFAFQQSDENTGVRMDALTGCPSRSN